MDLEIIFSSLKRQTSSSWLAGIGIMPILPMIEHVDSIGSRWKLIYGGKTIDSMAFPERLENYSNALVDIVPQDTHGHPDIQNAISSISPNGLIFCCGPKGLLQDATESCADNGRSPDDEFQVELRRSGILLTVPKDRTLLDVIREPYPILFHRAKKDMRYL